MASKATVVSLIMVAAVLSLTPSRNALAQSPTPPIVTTVDEGDDPPATWQDYVQMAATVVGVIVATAGLGGVLYSLYQARRDQRMQSGPYVRIDVAPQEGTEDFKPPKTHFENTLRVVDLVPDMPESEKLTLSAWIRNYQSHQLGFALAISAFFVLETKGMATEEDGEGEAEYFLLQVPYLEHDKPVRVDLFKIARDAPAFLWLASLSFYDFYDRRHEHQFGQSTNALHGRLSCDYSPERVESIPEARPRGPKVEFE